METQLDLDDIQGVVAKAYATYGFPIARYLFFRIEDPIAGRDFVNQLLPLVTTAVSWWPEGSKIPDEATNIAFTYQGLRHLEVPQVTLHGFPDEFSMGMKARRDIIGDTGPNHFCRWDPVWLTADEKTQDIHIMVTIDAKSEKALEDRYNKIVSFAQVGPGRVVLLTGHRAIVNGERKEDLPYQPASVIFPKPEELGCPGGKEHFGYSDGISTTYFLGCGEDPNLVIGGGKPVKGDPKTREGWKPLEAGEFVFGHRDEALEYPEAPGPPLFSRNGTFLVYRKLHQNVGSFNSYIDAEGAKFPGGKEALAAKFAGRWRNGAPLVTFDTEDKANRFISRIRELKLKQSKTDAETKELTALSLQLTAYDYDDDKDGAKCPFGAHVRRSNPRSGLRFGDTNAFPTEPGALSNRRRILRRGLPYGHASDPTRDDGDHGVVMLIINADLSRQFEFVQQQWFNFGNDFRLSNDQDPLLGNHGINENSRGNGRMMIEGDAEAKPLKPPYFCNFMPTLVETRGGAYFFVPSLTCLRMIGLGIIDPT